MRTVNHLKKDSNPKMKPWIKSPNWPTTQCTRWPGYSNPQKMKVGGLLKQQPIAVLVDTGSTNNFLNIKVATRDIS
ncbi:hypothetical protein B296_00009941 [Ensete ventricosum]|uniref:Uncharacterized protein n=1 Tax=Ensete ventricosum TaxID=4639 RepID=A0A427AA67_ENSVE|nr:hypothetical protein B296_00009941 [Ensete ventricosum]